MTQSNDIPNGVTRLEDEGIDLKLAVSALIETANRHQSNFERIVSETRDLRVETRDLGIETRTILIEMREDRTRVDATLDSINTALERIDRVIDYLLEQKHRE
jgi:hypothetical protein